MNGWNHYIFYLLVVVEHLCFVGFLIKLNVCVSYVCCVINKTTFGSFTVPVLYIQIPYLTLLFQNSGRMIARLEPSMGAIHSLHVFYSWKALVPNNKGS